MARLSKKERRAQIVEGMMQALAQWGYERASIQKIAACIDLTPGLVHYHFSTKHEILLATLDTLRERMQARHALALQRATPHRTLCPELTAWVDAHVGLGEPADTQAIAAWVAITAQATLDPLVREPYQAVVAHDIDQLRAALTAHHALPPERARDIAITLFATTQGIYTLWQTQGPLGAQGFAREMLLGALSGLIQEATP